MSRRLACLVGSAVVLALLTAPRLSGFASSSSSPQDKQDAKKTDQKDPKKAAEQEEDTKLTPEERKEYEAKGCGPKDVKHDAKTDKKTHPTPEPPADKAMIFVVRPTMLGNKIQTKLAIDGEWVGVNRGNNYFFVAVAPGEHYFCSTAENRSVLKFAVEAGRTYFLQQKIRMGFMKASNQLELITDAEGKVALGKTHPSTMAQKK